MNLRLLYLILAVLGAFIPYYHLVDFIVLHGFDTGTFIDQMTASPISNFFAWDTFLAGLSVMVLIVVEGRRQHMPYLWMYILFTIFVGVSMGLPAFLYARQRKLDNLTVS